MLKYLKKPILERFQMEMHDVFVNNLRTIRRQAGITQEKLAEKCAVSPTFIGEMEIGKKTPSFQTIKKLADTLGVKPYQLFLENQVPFVLDENLFATLLKVVEEVLDKAVSNTIENRVEQAVERVLMRELPKLLELIQTQNIHVNREARKRKGKFSPP